jgi:O-antigen/teichoic acid export membrane protein
MCESLKLEGPLARVLAMLRQRPGDVDSAHFRSRERFRRMALTSAASLGARAVTLLTSLVSIPLTYRYLGAERYGIWMVLTSIIGAMAFADLGIGNGVVNAISEAYGKGDRELARRHLTSALALLLCVAFIVCITGLGAFPFIPWMRVFNVRSALAAAEGARAFLVLFLWFGANIPLGIVARVQSGFQEAYWAQAIAAGGSMLSLLALVVVVIMRGSLPLLVFASTFGTILAIFVNAWVLFHRRPWLLPRRGSFSGDSARMILRLGLMFFVLQVASALGFTSDNIVITQILGAAAVAAYAVPQKLFSIVSTLVTIGSTPMWPAYGEAIARGDVEWVRNTFWRSIRWVMVVVCPISALLALFGPWIVRVVMGKSLRVPHALFIALAVWGVVAAASALMAVLLNGAGVLKSQTIIAVIASLSNLALSIFLTRRFGIIGVCLGSTIAQLAITIPASTFLIQRLFARIARAEYKQSSCALLGDS